MVTVVPKLELTLEVETPVSEAICTFAWMVRAELPVPLSSSDKAERGEVGSAFATAATSVPPLRMKVGPL